MTNNADNAEKLAFYMLLPYATRIRIDECGGKPCFLAIHPELYGCMAQGDSPQEALDNLKEARHDYLETLLELGRELPEPQFKFTSIHASSTSVRSVLPIVSDEEGDKPIVKLTEISPVSTDEDHLVTDISPIQPARQPGTSRISIVA